MLDKPWVDIPLIKPPKTSRIPDILSIDHLGELFAATDKLSYKVFFFTAHSMGMRLGEGIRLAVGYIDSTYIAGSYSRRQGQQGPSGASA